MPEYIPHFQELHPDQREAILKQARDYGATTDTTQGIALPDFPELRDAYPGFIYRDAQYSLALDIEKFGPVNDKDKLKGMLEDEILKTNKEKSFDTLVGKLFNKEYMFEELTDALEQELTNEAVASFGHIARISIDMNGLKMVNDYNNRQHSQGNMLLQLVGHRLYESPVLEEMRRRGIRVIIAREHGDDFSVTLIGKAGEPIDASPIATALQREIDSIEIDNTLVPLEKIVEKIGPAPVGFKLHASAGVGVVSVEEILHTPDQTRNKIEPDDSPRGIARKVIWMLIDESEYRMSENKDRQKEEWLSAGPIGKYYSLAISPRGAETAIAQIKMLTDMHNKGEIDTETYKKRVAEVTAS